MIDRCAPQTPVEFGVRHPSFSIISLMSFSCLREFVENSRHPKTPARVREGLVSGFWHRNPGNALDPLDPRMSSKTCKTRMFLQWFAPPHPPMKTYFKDAPRPPQDAPSWHQDTQKPPQDGFKTPQDRPQDGFKTPQNDLLTDCMTPTSPSRAH